MKNDLACFWLVLVQVPAPSVDAYRATPQADRRPVSTAVVPIIRADEHTLHVARFHVTVDVDPECDAVRIAWVYGTGRDAKSRTTVVETGKPFAWIRTGTTTVMACAFVNEPAARAWAVCRKTVIVPRANVHRSRSVAA